MKTFFQATVCTILALSLMACDTIARSPIGQMTQADAKACEQRATDKGDAAGLRCCTYIDQQITNAPSSSACGLLCLNEIKRTAAADSAALGAACGGVLPLVIGL